MDPFALLVLKIFTISIALVVLTLIASVACVTVRRKLFEAEVEVKNIIQKLTTRGSNAFAYFWTRYQDRKRWKRMISKEPDETRTEETKALLARASLLPGPHKSDVFALDPLDTTTPDEFALRLLEDEESQLDGKIEEIADQWLQILYGKSLQGEVNWQRHRVTFLEGNFGSYKVEGVVDLNERQYRVSFRHTNDENKSPFRFALIVEGPDETENPLKVVFHDEDCDDPLRCKLYDRLLEMARQYVQNNVTVARLDQELKFLRSVK